MTNSPLKPEPNPYGPIGNFFLAWGKDAQGRWVYVGLDHDESQELLRLQGCALDGDELLIVKPGRGTEGPDDTDRYLELHDKHEAVRLELCLRHAATRRGLTDRPH